MRPLPIVLLCGTFLAIEETAQHETSRCCVDTHEDTSCGDVGWRSSFLEALSTSRQKLYMCAGRNEPLMVSFFHAPLDFRPLHTISFPQGGAVSKVEMVCDGCHTGARRL